MGKSSGGVRGSGGNAATEQGYTAKMKRNILGTERVYRNNKDETMVVFSGDGTQVASFQGKGNRVEFNPARVPDDSIITHNHPLSIGKTGVGAIGHSFSKNDIVAAVGVNAREMRAVTPTYTFSIKRPKGGWGASEAQVKRAYTRIDKQVKAEMISYLNKTGWRKENIIRTDATWAHEVMKRMSRQFGWNYSKKRG